jgi:hypothetical protein
MRGKRISSAKEGLITFLKSLPTDSIFNIYSFGTNYETIFPESVNYDDNNL